MINVSRSFTPPIEDYFSMIAEIFETRKFTNRGPFVKTLESKIKEYLVLKESNILCTSNGTIPLQLALKLIAKEGEVITTPFSYVATTSSILWEGLKPIFVDIHPEYLTIDETKIEAAITEKTTCILATHVFGNACNIEEIEKIATKHNLFVIYDGAHCFGTEYKGKSIFEYGNVSTCSFHATKIFHTGEGGALFCNDKEVFSKLKLSHNFGHEGPFGYNGIGINGKMSELHAALGIAVLEHFQTILSNREKVVQWYLNKIDPRKVSLMKLREGTKHNYSYFPVIFKSEKELFDVVQTLNNLEIFPRRYFKPSLNLLEYCDYKEMPISESISSRILCLPLYYDLSEESVYQISDIVNKYTC